MHNHSVKIHIFSIYANYYANNSIYNINVFTHFLIWFSPQNEIKMKEDYMNILTVNEFHTFVSMIRIKFTTDIDDIHNILTVH